MPRERPGAAVAREAPTTLPNPPARVARRMCAPISHRHSMTPFAEKRYAVLPLALMELDSRMRGGGRIFEGQVPWS
jgi:hypothetical protein